MRQSHSFSSPALVNTIYGRWWHPEDEKAGPNPVAGKPLSWTDDFQDGLGNRISMLAFANPQSIGDEKQRADGHGITRFDKKTRRATFECWPRVSDVKQGDKAQFPGWPIHFSLDDNDGRKPIARLSELTFVGDVAKNPVVRVITEPTGEILYTMRVSRTSFQPPVFAAGSYTIKVGRDQPESGVMTGVKATSKNDAGTKSVRL